MQLYGAERVRLVIGKRTSMSRRTHAWLEWNIDSGTYVLDPTINWVACRADKLGTGSTVQRMRSLILSDSGAPAH